MEISSKSQCSGLFFSYMMRGIPFIFGVCVFHMVLQLKSEFRSDPSILD